MSQQTKKIDFINIDCDSNYFDTNEQIGLENTYFFSDKSIVSKVTGSNTAGGYFSNRKIVKTRQSIVSASLYPTSSVTIDPAGNTRKILSLDIDVFASSSIDSYKNGVEILRDKDWTAGLAKISAGTPGHLYDSLRYGIIDISASDSLYVANASSNDSAGSNRKYLKGEWTSTTSTDASGNQRRVYATSRPVDLFVDSSKFDPVFFVSTGGNAQIFSFPVTTRLSKMSESLILNGAIEPLDIRPGRSIVSSKKPLEYHTIRCQLGTGNANRRAASDFVLSVDYFSPNLRNRAVFLDTPGKLSNSSNITGSYSAYSEDYSTDENLTPPFEDAVYPRGQRASGSYDAQLSTAVDAFSPGGTTYVTLNQKSATCGFVFGDAESGTDSIVFGDKAYGGNRDNRRRKRTIMSLRDSESFVKPSSTFNDTNTVHFLSQSIEYPSMAPVNYNGPLMNSTVQSEIYKSGAIQILISGSIRPGNFDVVFYDSILNAKKRLGTL